MRRHLRVVSPGEAEASAPRRSDPAGWVIPLLTGLAAAPVAFGYGASATHQSAALAVVTMALLSLLAPLLRRG